MAMSALTVRPPWDHALLGPKRVENRPTRPPSKLIGQRFALHAGLSYDYDGAAFIKRLLGVTTLPARPVGVVFATAELAGYVERGTGACARQGVEILMSSPELEWALSDPWFSGPVALVLTDVRALPKPVRARGMNGYWPLPADVEARVLEQLEQRPKSRERSCVHCGGDEGFYGHGEGCPGLGNGNRCEFEERDDEGDFESGPMGDSDG